MKPPLRLILALTLLGLLCLSCLTGRANPKADALRKLLPYASPCLDTHSMEPELYGGDTILVMLAPYSELRIGSRVVRMDAWRRYGVSHVIVRNEGTATMPRWITQGINNARPDPGWLLEDNYVGTWQKIPKKVSIALDAGAGAGQRSAP